MHYTGTGSLFRPTCSFSTNHATLRVFVCRMKGVSKANERARVDGYHTVAARNGRRSEVSSCSKFGLRNSSANRVIKGGAEVLPASSWRYSEASLDPVANFESQRRSKDTC